MTKLVCDHTVRVVRDGKPLTVKPKTAFAFTEAEKKDILKARPGSLRNPHNEDVKSSEDLKRDSEAEKELAALRAEAEKAAERERQLAAENAQLKAQAAAAQQAQQAKQAQSTDNASKDSSTDSTSKGASAKTSKAGGKTDQGDDL